MKLDRIGRDGRLDLRFQRRGARSALLESRFTLPLQVLAPLHLDDGTAYLMLLNPTGGVLGGDCLSTQIVQERDTHVCIATPSATRVYRTQAAPAVQKTSILLGENATLEYFPDHVIPHAGSAFRQSLRIDIAAGGRALIWDAVASGRVAHGERWQFREFESGTEIFYAGQPVYLNRTKIDPVALPPGRMGAMESFDYSGSLAIVADGFESWGAFANDVSGELEAMPQACGGVSLLARHGCLVRLLTRSSADLVSMCERLWALSRRLILNLPPLDHRKY